MAEVEAATKELLDTRGGNFPSFHFLCDENSCFYRCRQGFGDRAFSCSEETKKQSITSYLAHGAAHTGSQNFQLLYSNQWFQKHMFKELAAVEKVQIWLTILRQVSTKSWKRPKRERRVLKQKGWLII